MKYKSTRGSVNGLSFIDTVLMGLASDGGLMVPESFPIVDSKRLNEWSKLSYNELSLEVLSLYISEAEISRNDLKAMIDKSYSSFRTKEVTPIRKIGDDYFLELFHGPTFAFKDVALQFLGNLFDFILKKDPSSKLTIVGATSGDTGSAAIAGLRGKENIECFILYPEGGVSKVQENQMTSVLDDNVHCIAVDNDFDHAQDIVKACFNDSSFKAKYSLGAVNSINWARILAQIVYYFYAYFRVHEQLESEHKFKDIHFSVPTGNFGDILAGYYAKKMGLPVGKFIVATNENDILHRFFSKGEYHRCPLIPTLSPSMDICISSNFERFLFDICKEDSSLLAVWMRSVAHSGKLTIEGLMLQKAQSEMCSYSASTDEVLAMIKDTYTKHNYLLCPHSAVAVVAARECSLKGVTISLLTASPAKFHQSTEKAIGVPFVDSFESKALNALSNLPKSMYKKKNLAADVDVIKREIENILFLRKMNTKGKSNVLTSDSNTNYNNKEEENRKGEDTKRGGKVGDNNSLLIYVGIGVVVLAIASIFLHRRNQ